MKILSLTHKPPYPPKDGGAIGILNIVIGIAKNNNHVHVLSMNTDKNKLNLNAVPEKISENLNISFIHVNTKLNFISALFNLFFSKTPYSAARFVSKSYLKALINLLKKESFDIIQLEGPYVGYCIPAIREYSNAKISLRSHNIENEIWQRNSLTENSYLKKIYYRILAKRMKNLELSLINKYDFIVPITNRDLQFFIQNGNNKPSFVMPAGIFINSIPESTNSILTNSIFSLSALDWIPNQEALKWFSENVWSKLSKIFPDLHFHVAGRNAPNWMKNYCETKKIIFHGEIENATNFMLEHGIMIVPLFSGSGLRVKIIEGLALGCPIVSTSIGAEGIEVTDGKEIMFANSTDEFIEKITLLLNDENLMNTISANAKKLAETSYDAIKITHELTEFYKQWM